MTIANIPYTKPGRVVVLTAARFLRSLTTYRARLSWAVADQGIVSLCNFLSTFLLARNLGISDFGTYSVAGVVLLFLNSIQNAAITQPHNVLAAQLRGRGYREFTGVLAAVQVVAALGVSAVIIASGLFLESLFAPDFGILLVALGIAAGPWMGQEFVRRILYTRSKSRAAFANDLVSYGLQLSGIVWLVVNGRASSSSALLVLGGSSAVACVLGAWQLRSHVTLTRSSIRDARHVLREVNDFGRWLVGRNILAWFGQYGNTWIILGLLGPAALGAYRAAVHLLNVLNPIRLMVGAYLPARASRAFSRGEWVGLDDALRKTLILALAPYLLIVVILIVFSDSLITLAYGDKFDAWNLGVLLAIAAVGSLAHLGTTILEVGLMAMRRSIALLYNSIAYAGLLLTIGVALIREWSIEGAAFASLIIGTVVLGFTYLQYRRLRPPIPDPAPAIADPQLDSRTRPAATV